MKVTNKKIALVLAFVFLFVTIFAGGFMYMSGCDNPHCASGSIETMCVACSKLIDVLTRLLVVGVLFALLIFGRFFAKFAEFIKLQYGFTGVFLKVRMNN